MDDFNLSKNAAALRAAILERHAGKGDMDSQDHWPLQEVFDTSLPYPADGDDAAHSRWEDACRAIAVAVIAAGCLTAAAATNELAHAWVTGNSPERAVPAGDWLAAFNAVGYIADDKSPPMAPDGDQVLYRGATPERRLGLAWTERLEIAKRFADDLKERHEDGRIYSAHVEAWRVKARFNAYGEERECVIDTTDLAMEVQDDVGMD